MTTSEKLAKWCEENENHIAHQFFRELEGNEEKIQYILDKCKDPNNWKFDYMPDHRERWNCVPFHRQLFGYVKSDGTVQTVQGE